MDMTTSDGRPPSMQAPSSSRRLAAAAALLVPPAALLVVAPAAVRFLGLLIFTLGLVVLAVMAAWSALVHRGARRVVAAVVAVGALGGAVLVLLGTTSILRIAVVVVLVVASAAAARCALVHDLAPRQTGRTVGPSRKGTLLINPRSGGGKVMRFDLEAEARCRGIRAVVLRPGDDLRALAEMAVADGADVLGMAGGDGSQALVADVARRHDVAHVCVPAGTRNHFALDLGLDRGDVVGALDAFGPALERRIDLGQIGDRIFVNNASLGVYATVVQSDAYRDAELGATARMLPDLLGPGGKWFDLRFDLPDGAPRSSADMVLISNDVYRLDSMTGSGTRPRIDDGLLGVVTVTIDRPADLPTLMSLEASGRIQLFRGYRAWSTPEFVVHSSEPLVDVGVDGEAIRLPPPLRFRSLPGVLRVRTPLATPGAPPASMAPGGIREAVPALLRVLAGRSAAVVVDGDDATP